MCARFVYTHQPSHTHLNCRRPKNLRPHKHTNRRPHKHKTDGNDSSFKNKNNHSSTIHTPEKERSGHTDLPRATTRKKVGAGQGSMSSSRQQLNKGSTPAHLFLIVFAPSSDRSCTEISPELEKTYSRLAAGAHLGRRHPLFCSSFGQSRPK